MMSAEPTADRLVLRRIVWPLAVAETIVWASVYYIFPALLPVWEADLGWSKTVLSGAFTLSLVATAIFAPITGRLIDKGFGRAVLAGGALGGAVLLALLTLTDQVWQFYALWFGIGIAASCSLYQACFALLTYALGDRARRAITLVSLVAGFAGTVAFPSAHALVDIGGWRLAVLVFAGVVAAVALPLFWKSAGAAVRHARTIEAAPESRMKDAMRLMARLAFWLLAVSFALIAINHGIVTTHILPILAERGVTDQAAILAASMIGPMQVAGRLAMMAAERHVSTRAIAVGCDVALAIAVAMLLAATLEPGFVVGFVILMGAGIGVTSIVRPVVVAELMGRSNFGLISGLLAMPTTIGYAAAPTLAALIWEGGGYDRVLAFALAVTLVGLGALLWAWQAAAASARRRGEA